MKKPLVLLILLPFLINLSLAGQPEGEFTDERDGRLYRTVRVGDQVWMAENLAYLPAVHNVRDLSWDESRYWVYDYFGDEVDEAKKTECYSKQGVLYNWAASVTDVCPSGWRIPEEEDWQQLEIYMGMEREQAGMRGWRSSGAAGKKLKAVSGWKDSAGTDDIGFGVLAGGLLGYETFECMDYGGYFWVGTATHKDNAWIRAFNFSKDGIKRIEERKWFGCSVRCIKAE